MESIKKIALLIFKHKENTLQAHELGELQEWLNQSEENRRIFDRLTTSNYIERLGRADKAAIWRKIVAPPKQLSRMRKFSFQRLLVASCIVLLLSSIVYRIYTNRKPVFSKVISDNKHTQITNKKIGENVFKCRSDLLAMSGVRLWNGSVVNLSSQERSQLQFVRVGRLQVVYGYRKVKFSAFPESYCLSTSDFAFPFYTKNTITSPSLSKIYITLTDGTEVTLNENSTLLLPPQFASDPRNVEVFGEAYFKVKQQFSNSAAKVPFLVKASSMEIKVLGTEFNVSVNKNDGTVRTTLVEGSIEAKKDSVVHKLRPGQEISLNSRGKLTAPRQVKFQAVIAWKNSIKYKDASLQEILEEIGRLYDINVICKETFNNRLSIYIPPKKTAAEALEYVRRTGVINFKIDKKNVFITR